MAERKRRVLPRRADRRSCARSRVGSCVRRCMPGSPSRRCAWPSNASAQIRGSSSTPIAASKAVSTGGRNASLDGGFDGRTEACCGTTVESADAIARAARRPLRKLLRRPCAGATWDDHGQAAQLRRGGKDDHARGRAPPAQGSEHPCREPSSAHPKTGADHDAVQVTRTGATIPRPPRPGRQSLQDADHLQRRSPLTNQTTGSFGPGGYLPGGGRLTMPPRAVP